MRAKTNLLFNISIHLSLIKVKYIFVLETGDDRYKKNPKLYADYEHVIF